MTSRERRVALIAVAAALGWIFRPLLQQLLPGIGISDAGIAMLAALALFVIPAGDGSREPLLTWEQAAGLRWDVLILVGGGLALATAISETGLADWIGQSARVLAGLPPFALPVALAASVGFMLPVATPPNAIVFSYGAVTSRRMLRAGAPLDLIGVAVAVLAGVVLGPLVI
jgi:sodium-dependent dicarboxylate transporter 2/3/5